MPSTSKDSAAITVDHGIAIDRTEEFGDYTVNFVTIRQEADLAPLLKGLPGDSCQCPHWGYLFTGTMTVRYHDRIETIVAGDAFYLPPGHIPMAAAGTEFVQFSPAAELKKSEEAMAANMARIMATD
jgi:hypothetical protein